MKHVLIPALLGASAISAPALAQDHTDHAGHDMPMPATPAPPPPAPAESPTPMPMDHSKMNHSGHSGAEGDIPAETEECLCNGTRITFEEGSGTTRLPVSGEPMSGTHLMSGDWMLMAHGAVSLQHTDHKGPRGDSKTYVTSMAMLMAQRDTSWGRLQFKSMLSFEPAMDPAGYPNLFATGETAGGLPLVDRQHPHDLFMELAARVDINAGSGQVFVYGGPVGEPAIGPSAFMHRGSVKYNPEPPITHHWFDSTHITYGVVTLGYSAPKWQIEASAFRGREPDEDRWNIEAPKLDSWSVRATLNPSPRWMLQASYAQIKEPEAIHPGEDEERFTSSVHYANAGFFAMAAFSSKRRDHGGALPAWLGEANWDLDSRNSLFGRIERVSNDELFTDHTDPLHDQRFAVTKFQAGYARRLPLGPFELALGGSLAAYTKPAALDAAYGDNPWGYTVFAKVSLGN